MTNAMDPGEDRLREAAVLLQHGHFEQAEVLYAEVLRTQPRNALAITLAAMAHAALGRRNQAVACYEQALAIRPDLTAVAQARADLCRELGRYAEAIAGYASVLAVIPNHVEALLGRAAAQCELRRSEAALADYDRVLALQPDLPIARLQRARLLMMLGHTDQALAAYTQLLEIDPGNADAHNGRGAALRAMRRYEEALESFAAALRSHPAHAAAASNHGLTLHDLGRSREAAEHLGRAVNDRPQHAPSLHNLGMILHSIDRHDEAARCYSRLIEIAPDFDYAAGSLARSRLACCDWSGIDEDRRRMTGLLAAGAHPADPLTALMVTESPTVQLECIRRFAAREYPASPAPLWRGERYGHRRIRVAYLSADFHDHPVAHLLAGVLERHDRRHFETIGISLRREAIPGAMHDRLRAAFEHFHDAAGMTDHALAGQLREWEVDIAVDLNGYTRGGRLGVFARRPAPVQVNYLGFSGSSGAPYIDYLIADSVVVPAGSEHHYSESIVRLPYSFMPNDDRQPIAGGIARRSDAGLPDAGIVFCAFSNAYKINPPLFDVWMSLLREITGSVLWLREGTAAMVANLSREAAARGVSPQRLVFAPSVPDMDRHLARYRLADLFLDTSPYGAHATARDALWAGLPVLTRVDESFASRVAGSLLEGLALPELVTADLREYHDRARQLALAPARLSELRRDLDRRRLTAPCFDTGRFRADLESAYRLMWERSERGEAPAHINLAGGA